MSRKVGLFGGSFNPVHRGHRESVEQVWKTFELEKVIIMPSFVSPNRKEEDLVNEKNRLEMVKLAFFDLAFVEVSNHEIERRGVSYTIDTIEYLNRLHPDYDIHLIIGLDQFLNFHMWKDYEVILQRVNLVVTSRPGYDLEVELNNINENIKRRTSHFTKTEWDLTCGKKIYIIQLVDINVSSSEIRKKLRSGEKVGPLLNLEVENYIEKENLYQPIKEMIQDYEAFTRHCAQFLYDGKALNVIAKDMREQEKPMEFALIASGTSRKHAMALAEQVAKQVKAEYKILPLNIDGQVEGQWIVLDYGSLMVHVFYDFTRQEYQLEQLWCDSKDLKLELK